MGRPPPPPSAKGVTRPGTPPLANGSTRPRLPLRPVIVLLISCSSGLTPASSAMPTMRLPSVRSTSSRLRPSTVADFSAPRQRAAKGIGLVLELIERPVGSVEIELDAHIQVWLIGHRRAPFGMSCPEIAPSALQGHRVSPSVADRPRRSAPPVRQGSGARRLQGSAAGGRGRSGSWTPRGKNVRVRSVTALPPAAREGLPACPQASPDPPDLVILLKSLERRQNSPTTVPWRSGQSPPRRPRPT